MAPWVFTGEHKFRLEPLNSDRRRFHQGEFFKGLLVPFFKKILDTEGDEQEMKDSHVLKPNAP